MSTNHLFRHQNLVFVTDIIVTNRMLSAISSSLTFLGQPGLSSADFTFSPTRCLNQVNQIDNVRYQAQFPDRFRDDESSDEFNSAAGQTCKKFRLKFKFWRLRK